jgi:hypothetical protein
MEVCGHLHGPAALPLRKGPHYPSNSIWSVVGVKKNSCPVLRPTPHPPAMATQSTDCTTKHFRQTKIREFYEAVYVIKPITLYQCQPSCLLMGTQPAADSCGCIAFFMFLFLEPSTIDDFYKLRSHEVKTMFR